jgi:hypothetical protein
MPASLKVLTKSDIVFCSSSGTDMDKSDAANGFNFFGSATFFLNPAARSRSAAKSFSSLSVSQLPSSFL